MAVGGLALVALLLPTTAPTAAAGFSPGAPGLGDPYFPDQGNSGYQVENYDISIRHDPAQNEIVGRTVITFRVLSALTHQFYVDLKGMTIDEIRLNDAPVTWTREGPSSINVRIPIFGTMFSGAPHQLSVSYHGTPVSVGARTDGWIRTSDGSLVLGEPNGASTWFPSNDHPSDKATFTLRLTTPQTATAVANGVRVSSRTESDGWRTTVWRARDAMVPYAATVAIGDYTVRERTSTVRRLPVIDAVGSMGGPAVEAGELDEVDAIIRYFEKLLGVRYPFETLGAIVSSDNLGTALETQTRPVYSRQFFSNAADVNATEVIAHEQAHQWFGDQVAIKEWKDLWLNEGFATYLQWLWLDHQQIQTVDQSFNETACSTSAEVWSPPGIPDSGNLFSSRVYTRGAMTLHALRQEIGDDAFFQVLHVWASQPPSVSHTTRELITMTEQISGRDLEDFFQTWLYTPGRVAGIPCHPITGPSAPRSVTIAQPAPGAGVTVSWRPPADSGGSRVTYYSVWVDGELRAGRWARTQSVTLLPADLPPGRHVVSVGARNSVGQGARVTRQVTIR